MAAIAAFGVMMNKLDKQALRKAAQNATDGPWVEKHGEVTTVDYEIDGVTHLDHICDCEIICTESPNAEFIAAANPATMLALLDENEALEKRAVELTAENADLKHPGTYLPSKIDTPETDAFTNEMQAQGVERCAAWFQDNHEYCRLLVTMMREFAQKLRDGKA